MIALKPQRQLLTRNIATLTVNREGRAKLREYIFTALVAKTDFDFIAQDKGMISNKKAVDAFMTPMEEFANWEFHFTEEKLIDNPNYFYSETAFLKLFLSSDSKYVTEDYDTPDSLD